MGVKKIDSQMFLKSFEKINDKSFISAIDEKIRIISEMTPCEALKNIDLESLEFLMNRCRMLAEKDTQHDLSMVESKIIEVIETSMPCSTNFLGVF